MEIFCLICQRYEKAPANAQGVWTTRGIKDWNHATEMLKLHNESKWHKDALSRLECLKSNSIQVVLLSDVIQKIYACIANQ